MRVPGIWERNHSAGPEGRAVMKGPQLFRMIGDPRGPEVTTAMLSDDELAKLLDALYRHLDADEPAPSAVFWYEAALEESLRRAPRHT